MIYVENKRRKLERIQKQYPNADILDLTSTAKDYAKKLSPFYPHGGIPIPFTEGEYGMSVEGIWQGLKVFETEDINQKSFENDTMQHIKRSERFLGKTLGHRKGTHGEELLNYFDARMLIYLPCYLFVLEHRVQKLVAKIALRAKEHDIVFLDYNTNIEVRDISKPLSHAGLLKCYIEGRYPKTQDNLRPMTQEEMLIAKSNKKKNKKNVLKEPLLF